MEKKKNTAREAVSILRGLVSDRSYSFVATIAICHAKRAALSHFNADISCSDDIIGNLIEAVRENDKDGRIVSLVGEVFASGRYFANPEEAVRKVYGMFPDDSDELAKIILDIELEEDLASRLMRYDGITPRSVAELAVKVLDIADGNSVADFGTGTGSFLVRASREADCELVYGCDVNSTSVAIAKMRAEVMGSTAVVEQADMFHIDGMFDRCFSNYPFVMKMGGFKDKVLELLGLQGYEGIPRFQSSDWLFNLQLVSRLKEGGKAVGVMTRGSSYNGADEKIRHHFIENGWVEAVIALPEGMFSPYSGIPTTMIILSKGNEEVRLIDASGLCQKSRRETTFSDDDIANIMRLLSEDSDGLSKRVAYKELADDGFILNPEWHLGETIEVRDGISIENLSLKITRGSGWGKKQLEEFNSNTPTEFKYLMLQNIVDGEIEDDLPCLTEIDSSQDKYCIKDGDLLLSKIGPNFKVAVANVPDGEKVLATGNLYIISFDQEKVDSRYVKLYLDTDQGAAQLRRACVGTTMPSIPTKAFGDILIPMVNLDEQAKIIERYEELRREIAIHKTAIDKARKKIASLLDEGQEKLV
ncbi:N-6 DNA methylase [Slackia piriformis]